MLPVFLARTGGGLNVMSGPGGVAIVIFMRNSKTAQSLFPESINRSFKSYSE